jgi:HK97 family phage major capsid protein
MSETNTKRTFEQAMSCITMARAIRDQYPDASQMPADKLHEMKSLVAEGNRLKDLADTMKQADALDGWAAAPADGHPALEAMAKATHSQDDIDNALDASHKRVEQKAFLKWLQGKERTTEEKAALVENATGEVLVPHDIVTPIFTDLPHLGTFRKAGPLIRPTTSDKVDVRSLTNATAGWGKLEVGNTLTDANVVPNTPANVIEVHDLLALSQVGEDELADTDVSNLPGMISQIIGLKFAEMEDDAFANGSGTSRPFGLALRATQASPLITQSVTSATGGIKADDLKSLPYKVPTVFRNNGAYYLADDAAMAVSLLKDSTSNYLWQPAIRAGDPATLFGYAAYTLEGLPTVASGNSTPSVIFGDTSLGYMVADRQQITMQRLNERYAELGLVGFKFKLRVGGDVVRPKAFAKYIVVD